MRLLSSIQKRESDKYYNFEPVTNDCNLQGIFSVKSMTLDKS